MPRDTDSLKILITAGEASGDVLGARLMHALKEEAQGAVEFIGVGGALMEAQGLKSLFPMSDLSVMGVMEVLPRLNKIMKRLNQTVALAAREKPDVIVTIDSPDFSFRVASRIKKAGGKAAMVHYVAPTVWAWRPERAAKVAALYDGMMCLFPFEPPYFEAEGMKAAFVGHSLMESGFETADGNFLREELGIPAQARVIGALFGSRMGELNRVGPSLRETLIALGDAEKDAHILAPTFPHLESQVLNLLQGLKLKHHIVTDPARKRECFAAMDMALATSGTVGLELAVADVPHLIAYKINALTYRMIKRKIIVAYAHLVNILLGRAVVPEFIQDDVLPGKMGQTAADLLQKEELRAAQRAAFAEARALLNGAGGARPSAQAARFVLDCAYSRSSIGT